MITTSEELSYIQWFDTFRFQSKVPLGSKGIYYIFEAEYNVRSERWYITISTEDEIVLIQNKKLILNTDLLALCFNKLKPDCALVPIIENNNILKLDYDAMVSGFAKLFSISNADLNETS
jgi:hypothetical protein